MKTNIWQAVVLAGMILASCGIEDGLNGGQGGVTCDVHGKVEKGPFVRGSVVSVQPMDAGLQVSGGMYGTVVTDDIGNFVLGSKAFSAPYAEIMSTGYFFNEYTGTLSDGTLTLRALVELDGKSAVNVNVLTHLAYGRVKTLVLSGLDFKEANARAQKELFEAFGLDAGEGRDVSSFSIVDGDEDAAMLVAISSLLLADRSEAAITEYLSMLSEDFGADGQFSDGVRATMDADKIKLAPRLPDIRKNIIARYDNLGLEVVVGDLSPCFDWDGDGIAGNEILGAGESAVPDRQTIDVPNEGGSYSVRIDSPVPVYLEPQIGDGASDPDIGVPDIGIFEDLYADYVDQNMSCEYHLDGNVLNITVRMLDSFYDKTKKIALYDYVGNLVASVTLSQSGKQVSVADAPLLGGVGESVVSAVFMSMTEGLADYNLIEQYYAGNKLSGMVQNIVTPDNGYIYQAWAGLYQAVSRILSLKEADASLLGVYGDYCNVLLAMCYSNLVYGWDAVPYRKSSSDALMLPRTEASVIFDELKENLQAAIGILKEKKNEPFGDMNSRFFVSKDVARVLLANILMYEGDYAEALPLLEAVIDNGFYELDPSADYSWSEGVDMSGNSDSKEIIFALVPGFGTRTSDSIVIPDMMPYMTLSDVCLSAAECLFMGGDELSARQYVDMVARTKNISLSGDDVLRDIEALRSELLIHGCTYFAFLKRCGLAQEVCDIAEYRLLFPIPDAEMMHNSMVTQNPGY